VRRLEQQRAGAIDDAVETASHGRRVVNAALDIRKAGGIGGHDPITTKVEPRRSSPVIV
jgi:hypothetical protein